MNPEDLRLISFLSEALQPGVAINRIGYVQIDGALAYISERLAKLAKLERPSQATTPAVHDLNGVTAVGLNEAVKVLDKSTVKK